MATDAAEQAAYEAEAYLESTVMDAYRAFRDALNKLLAIAQTSIDAYAGCCDEQSRRQARVPARRAALAAKNGVGAAAWLLDSASEDFDDLVARARDLGIWTPAVSGEEMEDALMKHDRNSPSRGR